MRKWKLTYHRSKSKDLRGVWLESTDSKYYTGGPKDSYYPHDFTPEEFNMLRFLYIELYSDRWIHGGKGHEHGHDIKRIQDWLGDIVYTKLGERDGMETGEEKG